MIKQGLIKIAIKSVKTGIQTLVPLIAVNNMFDGSLNFPEIMGVVGSAMILCVLMNIHDLIDKSGYT